MFKYIYININNILLVNILLLVVGYIIFLIRKKYEDNTFFYRDIPKNLPIAVLSYYNEGKISDKTIWITILDLISKGYYKIEKDNDNYYLIWNKDEKINYKDNNLKDYELKLVNMINNLIRLNKEKKIDLNSLKYEIDLSINSKEQINNFYNSLKSEIKNTYGFYRKNENTYYSLIILFIYSYLLFLPTNITDYIDILIYSLSIYLVCNIAKYLTLDRKGLSSIVVLVYIISMILLVIPIFIRSNYNFIVLIFSLFNPILIIVISYLLKTTFGNKKQIELKKEINGLKNFLINFSTLEEKEIDYIKLYDRYYTASVALDVKLENNPYQNLEYDDNSLDTLNSMDLLLELSDVIFGYNIK